MSKDGQRSGPRTEQKRGPKAPRATANRAPSSYARPRPADEAGERHLLNYRNHFAESTQNEDFFRATRAVVIAARRWRKLANDRIKGIGQTMARWETLFLVAFSDDELTQSELARLISVEGPTMVRMLDVLAKEGLIVRRQSATDRRVTTNRITRAGARVIREIMAITDKLRAEVFGSIEPRRLALFIDVTMQILHNIDALGPRIAGTPADGNGAEDD